MIIVGAGMAGLLAARMLSHRKPTVWERQRSLPNNHSAVLRFRTSQVGDILGIPFKRVNMIRDVIPWMNPIADSLAYSYKNTGAYRSDRSVTRGLVSEERFIAPPDLIERMAEGVKIEFGREYDPNDPHVRGARVLSTIPMPSLMEKLDYEMAPDFEYKAGLTVTAAIENCDAYISLLVPDPSLPFSRISITGNQLIVEVPTNDPTQPGNETWLAHTAAALLGITLDRVSFVNKAKPNTYNKILPIADETRKEFMFWATQHHDVYSLGRFATWRPGLLLDDLVQDIRLIDKWSSGNRSGYDLTLHTMR